MAGTEGSEDLSKKSASSTDECFEGFSRAMFKFNHALDGAVFEPVARGYRALPVPIRKGTGNAMDNLRSLLTLSNNVLQGDFKKAGTTAARFAVNTTVGILGIFDPAAKMGLKEQGKELPAAIMCISPWADPAATGESYNREMAEKDLLIGPIFKRMWDEYNLDGFGGYFVKEEDLDSENPYICPIKGDYTNSPPIMIQVGGAELLLSDSRTLKNVLERDGVEHEYKEWEDLWHVFQIEAMLPESIESFKMFGNFLNKYIGVKV